MSISAIEWTEQTWNPIVGCSLKSPGCTHCYAMGMAARIEAMNAQALPGHETAPHYAGTTRKVNGAAVWTGKIAMASDEVLLAPLRRKKPTIYFVNSMGDLFHEDCPDESIDRVFAIMLLAKQHTFQVLTKRAARMRAYFAAPDLGTRIHIAVVRHFDDMIKYNLTAAHDWPLPNVWLGVSTERQQEAEMRIPELLATPAAIHFISYEPALGPIDLMMLKSGDKVYDAVQGCIGHHIGDGEYDGAQPCNKLDWIIAGGESGPKARPMHPDWARSLRDQCKAAGVDFFFKQWGSWHPHRVVPGADLGGDVRAGRVRIVHPSGRSEVEVFEATKGHNTERGSRYMANLGKKSTGRLLDGVEHNAMPPLRRTS